MRNCLVIDLDRCSGCDGCVAACKLENNVDLGVYYNRVHAVGPTGTFPDIEQYWIPLQCQQCENPGCIEVCPTGASYRDEATGVVLVNAEECIGCESCLKGCPYNVRTLNPNTNVVEKCTLCFQRHEEEDWVPACVHNCCCGARYFGDLDDPDSSAAKAVAAAGAGELMAEGLHDMERALSKRHSGTRQELAVDFTGAFAGTSSWKGRYATPYESVFTSEEGLLFQDSYHEVYRLYRQNSVRKSPGYDFPDDHLSYLCEFQALLASRAVRALETNDAECALEQVRLSQHVLHDHILSWFDDFEELALHLVKTRFYRGVLKMSKGFFLFDAEMLADMAEELERL